ncbi:MAG: hypothetical protein RJB26_1901 [Pseudomonadota bacterium]|jgi:LysR family hydrogen peroxide-inducible transcriptional activator
MNLRDLKYLVALADTRHFGKAAERCFISQPTLSAQIKKLEDYLGVALVERQPRNVALTPAGQEVVERARRVIRDTDDIVDLAQLSRDPLAGKLRIGLIPTIGPYLLPHVMLKLRKALPKLQVLLFEYQTRVLLQKLRAGEIDMGVLALPVDEDGFDTCELYEEPFLVAVPAGHRFAEQKTVKPNELNGEKLLLLEDGHCLRDQALEVCSLLSVDEETDFRATSLETLRQMVGSGLGITLLPKLAAEGPFAASKTLVTKPFANPQPGRTVGTVWRRSSTRRPAIEAVNGVLAKAMATKS